MSIDTAVFDEGGAVYNARAVDYNVIGDGSTDDRAALNTLLNSTIPSSGGEVVFPQGTYRVGSALTIPANVTLRFAPGARILPTDGAAISINAAVDAGPHQWLDFSGTNGGGSFNF